MSSTKVDPAPRNVGPITDPITVLGYAVGSALIFLGLLFFVLALTN